MSTPKKTTKYRIQSPGYRYLNPGETLKRTDGWWPWNWSYLTERDGERVGKYEGKFYRRAYNPKRKVTK